MAVLSTNIGSGGAMTTNGSGSQAPINMTPAPNTGVLSANFAVRVANMLQAASDAQTQGTSNLDTGLNNMQNVAVQGGIQPYDPTVDAGQAVQNSQTLQNSFAPGTQAIQKELQDFSTSGGIVNQNLQALEALPGTQKNSVSAGQNLVTNDGTILYQGHSYTPYVDPATGTEDAIDETTGQLLSQVKAQANQSTNYNSGSDVVGGVDVTKYNGGADPNYASEVNTAYQQIEKAVPAPTATSLQAYISGLGGKGAPVTGTMIMNAATTYKIDPNLLTAIMYHETTLGSSGEAPANYNPGGVENSDGTYVKYQNWNAGVNATAQILAKYQVGGSSITQNNTPGSTSTSAIGSPFSPDVASKVSQLPPAFQGYVQGGLFGVGYIDASRVPATQTNAVQIQAARLGIPYLDQPADVAAAQALNQAQQNMDLMNTTASQVLGNGLGGFLKDVGGTLLNSLTLGNALPQFNKFNSYATAAVNELKALAGSGGGFRITQSEIDTATANLPESTDTLANAKTKIAVLQGLIDTTVAKIFPNANIPIILPDGTKGSIPAQNYAKAVQLGAQPM